MIFKTPIFIRWWISEILMIIYHLFLSMMFIYSIQLGNCLECERILLANSNVCVLRLDFDFLICQYLAVASSFLLEIIA